MKRQHKKTRIPVYIIVGVFLIFSVFQSIFFSTSHPKEKKEQQQEQYSAFVLPTTIKDTTNNDKTTTTTTTKKISSSSTATATNETIRHQKIQPMFRQENLDKQYYKDSHIKEYPLTKRRRIEKMDQKLNMRERFNNAKTFVAKLRDKKSINRNWEIGPGYNLSGGDPPTANVPPQLRDPSQWYRVDNGTCVPSKTGPEPWQKRAPYFILLGAMKCGTEAVTYTLWEHPQIVRNEQKEMHFFDGKYAKRSEYGINQEKIQMAYAAIFQAHVPLVKSLPMQNKYAMQSSPRYILSSDRIPDMIMCAAPWAKLLVILRNPVTRVESHFRFQNQARRRTEKPMVSWDTWIAHDLKLLTDAGVIRNNWTSQEEFDAFSGSPEEDLAWKTYQRSPNSHMIIGRGLYAIQVGHYFRAMDKIGKPRSDFYTIRSEDYRSNLQEEYNRIMDFLNLPHHVVKNTADQHTTSHQAVPMPDHIRKQLEDLFEPYNKRLYKLLGWKDDVWKRTT